MAVDLKMKIIIHAFQSIAGMSRLRGTMSNCGKSEDRNRKINVESNERITGLRYNLRTSVFRLPTQCDKCFNSCSFLLLDTSTDDPSLIMRLPPSPRLYFLISFRFTR